MILKSLTILLTRIYLVLINFLTSVIIARGLGPLNKGILATILLLVSIFSLFYRFGTDVSVIYHIKNKRYNIQIMIFNILVVFLFLLLSSIPVYYAVYMILSQTVLSEVTAHQFSLSVFLVGFMIFELYLQRFLLAIQKIKRMNLMLMIDRNMFLFFLWILYLRNSVSIENVMLVDILARFLVYIPSWIVLSKSTGLILRLNFHFIRDFFSFGFNTYLSGIIEYIITRVDMILIIILLSKYYVGLYSIRILAEKFLLVAQSIGFAWTSEMSKDKDNTPRISRLTLLISLIIALPLIIFARPLVSLVYGLEFADASIPLQFLLSGMILLSISYVIRPYLIIIMEKPFMVSLLGFYSLIINGVLNFFLIKVWQINGAAVATMTGYFVYTFFIVYYYSRKTNTRIKDICLINKDDLALITSRISMVFKKRY